jgi:hypothetical protein
VLNKGETVLLADAKDCLNAAVVPAYPDVFSWAMSVTRSGLSPGVTGNRVICTGEPEEDMGGMANNPVSRFVMGPADSSASTGAPTTVRQSAIRTRMKPRFDVLNVMVLPEMFCRETLLILR